MKKSLNAVSVVSGFLEKNAVEVFEILNLNRRVINSSGCWGYGFVVEGFFGLGLCLFLFGHILK
jgi:hypothetical protein